MSLLLKWILKLIRIFKLSGSIKNNHKDGKNLKVIIIIIQSLYHRKSLINNKLSLIVKIMPIIKLMIFQILQIYKLIKESIKKNHFINI